MVPYSVSDFPADTGWYLQNRFWHTRPYYDNTIIITNKQTEKSTQLELYQKIKVKMIGIIDNISIRNKLIVKILAYDGSIHATSH